jgi:membrane protein
LGSGSKEQEAPAPGAGAYNRRTLGRVRELVLRLFTLDPALLGRAPRALLRLARLLLLTPREFLRDYGFQWAAALAYYTVLSLVPIGILAFSLLDVFERFVELDLGDKVFELFMGAGLPDAARKAGDEVRKVVETARASGGKLGAVGTVLLVLAGAGMYSVLERAFNRVWKSQERRNPLARFRTFWLVVTLGPVLAGFSVWATARLRSPELLQDAAAFGFLLRFAVWVLPFLVTWTVFFLFYVALPNTRVRLWSALLGAIFAGSVWEMAKWGFTSYVVNAAQIDRLYGPLGVLPLFVIWIYVTWAIALLGAELAYVHQNFGAILLGVTGRGADRGAPREYQAMRLLVEIYRPFRDGSPPPDVVELGRRTRTRTEHAREILDDLQRADLVRRDRGGSYLPAREAARIPLAEIVAAVRGSADGIGEERTRRLDEIFQRAEEQRYAAFDGATLDDLLEGGGGR